MGLLHSRQPAPVYATVACEAKGRTVSNLIILNLGDVDQDLGGRVVECDTLEDGGTVVGDGDLSGGSRVKDLVHALRTQGRLDEVTKRESSNERRETGLNRG